MSVRHVCAWVVALLAVGLLSGPAAAQMPTRPLALRDYYALVDVSSPAISPDGNRVAYVRTRSLEEENRTHSEIWLADTDSGQWGRRLTSEAFDSWAPTWSPDGRVLAFRSSRPMPEGQRGGVWFLDLEAGGEAYIREGVEGLPVYSPDGLWMAFVKVTPAREAASPAPPPGATADEFEARVRERFKGRAVEWMGYRYDGSDALPDPRDPVATPPRELWIAPAGGGAPRQLTRIGMDVSDVAWSADSQRIVFAADAHLRDEHTYERHDLWSVDLGGQVTRHTDDGYVWANPRFSLDGQAIFARRELGLDAVIASGADRGAPVDVVRLDLSSSATTVLTDSWDLIPETLTLSADGAALRFLAVAAGERQLFTLPVAGGTVAAVTSGRRWIDGVSESAASARMAFVSESSASPGEVWLANDDGSNEQRLSHANDVLASQAAFTAARPLPYASVDGLRIQGWLLLPPGYTADEGVLPLLVSIHGGPHWTDGERFNFTFQLWANEGYAVLYTDPRGSLGYGEDFLWATWGGGWGGLDADDVLAGIDAAAERVQIDTARIGVSGYSYGGFLTNMLITRTDRFAAAISGAGISNWISDYGTADIPRTKESEFYGAPWQERAANLLWQASPIKHAEDVSTPTLFLHGERDWRVPIEQAEQMYTALRKQKVPARLVRYPEASHGQWTPADAVHRILEGLQWWRRWLVNEP